MIATKPVNLKARRKDHLDDTFNGRPVIVSEREYYDLLKAKQHNGAIRGIGKPEPLKDDKARLLSRRIDDADRLVYDIDGLQHIRIVSHKGHYADQKMGSCHNGNSLFCAYNSRIRQPTTAVRLSLICLF